MSVTPEINTKRYDRDGRELTFSPGKGGGTVSYKDLIDLAHKSGLVKLSVTVIHAPTTAEPYALCEATAVFDDGTSFTDIGDATPNNVTKFVAPHFIRMAATRAKGRALRDGLNIEEVTAEELGDGDSTSTQSRGTPSRAARQAANGVKAASPGDKTAKGLVVPPYNNDTDDGWVCEISGEDIYGGGNYTAAERAAFSANDFNGHIVGYSDRESPQALAWKSGKGAPAKKAATTDDGAEPSPWA
jgi:hypothetical protein